MFSMDRRRTAHVLLLVGLAFAAGCGGESQLPTARPSDAPSFSFDPNAWYVIRNAASNKVLDVSNAGCCNGAWVHQWEYEGESNQEWRITDLGNGYYSIIARHSGKGLDVEGASTGDGARIHQWTYQGLTNQQWSITSCGCGGSYIAARHSGKVIGLASGNIYSNGLGAKQYTNTGLQAQRWTFEEVP